MRKRLRRLFRLDDQNPLTGWHALALVAVFFAIIIIVNVIMAAFATGTFPGVVVENSYVASQNYNELLAEARAQAATGLSAMVTDDRGAVTFRLVDAKGEPVHGLTVSALVGRPSTTRQDRTLDFDEIGDGYRAEAALAPGRWQLDFRARRGEAVVFKVSRDVYVEPEAAQ